MSEARGTGRTTKQIHEAPQDAIYVFAGDRRYTDRLCRYLGRTDLVLVPYEPHAIMRASAGTLRRIVIDHAAYEASPLPASVLCEAVEIVLLHEQSLGFRRAAE